MIANRVELCYHRGQVAGLSYFNGNMPNENEKLTKEQLMEVIGGTYLESAGDAEKFAEQGNKVYSSEIFGIPIMEGEEFGKLRDAFSQYGVTIKDNSGLINANEYYIDGRKVSREEAWNHIQSQRK